MQLGTINSAQLDQEKLLGANLATDKVIEAAAAHQRQKFACFSMRSAVGSVLLGNKTAWGSTRDQMPPSLGRDLCESRELQQDDKLLSLTSDTFRQVNFSSDFFPIPAVVDEAHRDQCQPRYGVTLIRCQAAVEEPHEAEALERSPGVHHYPEYDNQLPCMSWHALFRSIFSPNAGYAGRRIFEALKDFQPYKDASRISIYLAMPTAEVQTDAIVRDALATGKQVFVPYLHKSPLQTPDTPARVMDMVHLENLQDYESLKLDRWGIPSVDPATVHQRQRILGGPDAHHSEQATLDFMVVPGVAFDFDEAGSIRRLGHGKGFYDFFINRYLAKIGTKGLAQEKPLLLYGLALTEQLVPASAEQRIPTDAHDRRLNGLILGNGEVKTAGKS
ncbi:hypothetical protein FDECE_13222 [Fusarium decemcellulare]|nr:hypothetical protein FDECE_13222 [Fusarium decemcellulare]